MYEFDGTLDEYILRIGHSRYRNRGLGRRLVAALEHEAQQRGITLLVLDTIDGELAEQLYLKLGYARARRRNPQLRALSRWPAVGNGYLLQGTISW